MQCGEPLREPESLVILHLDKDAAGARKLARRLTESGCTCWCHDDVKVGESIPINWKPGSGPAEQGLHFAHDEMLGAILLPWK